MSRATVTILGTFQPAGSYKGARATCKKGKTTPFHKPVSHTILCYFRVFQDYRLDLTCIAVPGLSRCNQPHCCQSSSSGAELCNHLVLWQGPKLHSWDQSILLLLELELPGIWGQNSPLCCPSIAPLLLTLGSWLSYWCPLWRSCPTDRPPSSWVLWSRNIHGPCWTTDVAWLREVQPIFYSEDLHFQLVIQEPQHSFLEILMYHQGKNCFARSFLLTPCMFCSV